MLSVDAVSPFLNDMFRSATQRNEASKALNKTTEQSNRVSKGIVEVGLLIFVLAAWPLFWFLRKTNSKKTQIARTPIAAECSLGTVYWIVDRATKKSVSYEAAFTRASGGHNATEEL